MEVNDKTRLKYLRQLNCTQKLLTTLHPLPTTRARQAVQYFRMLVQRGK